MRGQIHLMGVFSLEINIEEEPISIDSSSLTIFPKFFKSRISTLNRYVVFGKGSWLKTPLGQKQISKSIRILLTFRWYLSKMNQWHFMTYLLPYGICLHKWVESDKGILVNLRKGIMKGVHSLWTFQLVFTVLLGRGRELLSSVYPESNHQTSLFFLHQTSYLLAVTTMWQHF